jgi:hypothetical protein
MKRIQELLKIYYLYQVFHVDDDLAEIQYCDMEEPAIISYYLALIGQSLISHPINIVNLVSNVNDFHAIAFGMKDSQLSALAWQQSHILDEYVKHRKKRPIPEDRDMRLTGQLYLESFRAQHHWYHFLAPVWMWYSEQISGAAAKYATKARRLLIVNTCCVDAFVLSGDSVLRVIASRKTKEDWIGTWLHDGGLTSFVLGAVSDSIFQ